MRIYEAAWITLMRNPQIPSIISVNFLVSDCSEFEYIEMHENPEIHEELGEGNSV